MAAARALRLAVVAAGTLALPALGQPAPAGPAAGHAAGTLSDGAFYAIDQPAHPNGTVLLWSHGYSPKPPAADVATAPPSLRARLLSDGYALVASSYAQAGWALASAPRDQMDALAAYAAKYGKPRRTIAWGASMGGLVTVALAERATVPGAGAGIDGALPVCGSVAGALPMMNMALDGAFAFATLAAPDAGLHLVHTGDDRANGLAAQRAVLAAQATPQGRARIALAATLGGLPGWTQPGTARPGATDTAAQESQQASSLVAGLFLPRAGQEALAGGVFSWNTGVDYAAQLRLSGRQAYVERLYQDAHLRLADDLARLAATARIAASPAAVGYMRANYTPSGALAVPMVAMHTVGDGLTSPSLERGYRDLVAQAGRSTLLRDLFVDRAGHCDFSDAEYRHALSVLESRLDRAGWAEIAPPADTRFVADTPPPLLRPCAAADCQGRAP